MAGFARQYASTKARALSRHPGPSGHHLRRERGAADLEGGQEPLRRPEIDDRDQLALAKQDVHDAVVAMHHLSRQRRKRGEEGGGLRQQLQSPVQEGHRPAIERVLVLPPIDGWR